MAPPAATILEWGSLLWITLLPSFIYIPLSLNKPFKVGVYRTSSVRWSLIGPNLRVVVWFGRTRPWCGRSPNLPQASCQMSPLRWAAAELCPAVTPDSYESLHVIFTWQQCFFFDNLASHQIGAILWLYAGQKL